MSVYVDGMRARFGRMILCHMVADTPEELHAMADRIGMRRAWVQGEGYRLHYDVSLTRRKRAIAHGAREITRHELGRLLQRWRTAGTAEHPRGDAREDAARTGPEAAPA